MIGLALGRRLLAPDRLALPRGAGRRERALPTAVEESIARAGRTVLFAGTALAVGMLGALLIAPGALLVSATMGVIVACLVAVLVALFAMPAGLALLGTNVNRWQFGLGGGENPWVRLSQRALRKPGVAAFFVLLPLLALSAPALALDTGPPNVANLPPDNASRKSYEAFEQERGAGWSTPFEVTFRTEGPITTTQAPARPEALPGARRARARASRPCSGRRRCSSAPRCCASSRARSSSGGRQLDAARARPARVLLRGDRPAPRRARDRWRTGAKQLAQGLGQAAEGSDQIATRRDARRRRRRSDSPTASRRRSAGRRRSSTRNARRARAAPSGCSDNIEELDKNSLSDESTNSDDAPQRPARPRAVGGAVGASQPRQRLAAAAADPQCPAREAGRPAALSELGPLKTNVSDYVDRARHERDRLAGDLPRPDAARTRAHASSRAATPQLESGIARTASGADAARRRGRPAEHRHLGAARRPLHAARRPGRRRDRPGCRPRRGGRRAATGSGAGIQSLLDGVVRVRSVERQRSASSCGAAAPTSTGRPPPATSCSRESRVAAPDADQRRASPPTPRSGGNTARVIVVPRERPVRPRERRSCAPALERETRRDRAGARLGGRRRRPRRAARRLRQGDHRALPVPGGWCWCSSPSWCCWSCSARRCWRSAR